MTLELKHILHTADLARLDLALGQKDPEAEIQKIFTEISKVLDYFNVLNELKTDEVEPLFMLFEDVPGARADVPETYPHIDEILGAAQELSETLFVVPKIL